MAQGKPDYRLATACESDPRTKEYVAYTKREPEPGTRTYREDGNWPQFRLWLLEMRHFFEGDVIPLEWVAQFVGVTRAAVHRKAQGGGLTVFVFGMEETVKGALGGTRRRMRQEFRYALLSECHYWRDSLLKKQVAKEDEEAEKSRRKRK